MDRDSRRLSHNKGNKITTQLEGPLSSQGDDGDQIMVGYTLYIKSQGDWVAFESTNVDKGKIGKWIEMTLLNSWVDYNTNQYVVAAYMMDALGFVHLRGVLKTENASDHNTNEAMCILPPVYRPHRKIYALVPYDGDNSRRFLVHYDGTVGFEHSGFVTGGVSVWTSIDQISWWVGKERLRQL